MHDLAERIAGLSAEERALLELMLAEDEIRSPAPQISRRATETAPLSFAQERLWFLEQLVPGTPLYTMPGALQLSGPLDLGVLRQSLNALVVRHEALRTSFGSVDDQPIQQVCKALDLALPLLDLTALPAGDQPAALQQLISVEAGTPFDLARGPLIRTTLVRLAPDDHVLLVTLHHLIADGWSLGILLHDLTVLYTASLQGRPAPLAELPLQYADFAAWQREWLDEAMLEQLLGYWRKQLHEPLPLLTLPADRPRAAELTFAGAQHPLALPRSLTDALVRLSTQEQCTLFMTLLAAFDVLLARYSGQTDIIVGTPVANRNQEGVQHTIGCFVNLLALRTDLSGSLSFRELLRRVRAVALDAYAHQDLPFEKLVENLRPARHQGYAELFQVLFVLHSASTAPLAIPDLTIKHLAVDNGTAKFDLTFNLQEHPAGLQGWIEYNTGLFDAATIQRMAGNFQTLLEGIANDPDCRVSVLPILTPTERTQLLTGQHANQRDYPADRAIHQLFAAQATRTPNAPAATCEGTTLTYREIDQRANQLAHYLQRCGVGPEVRVGISVDHSLELIVGLLGILKAGGAYVPLDPTYPLERLQHMLGNAGVRVLLTSQEQRTKNKEQKTDRTTDRKGVLHTPPADHERAYSTTPPADPGQPTVVDLVAEWEQIDQEPDTEPTSGVLPDNLAYVIYTSGSTGMPKGVAITHRSLANFLHTMRERPGLTAQDTLLAITTIAFDIAGLELFLPLIVGARVVLLPHADVTDPARLVQALTEHQVTILQATPMTWWMLLEAGWAGNPHLTCLCGGEALPPQLAATLRDRCAALWNMYGPTETTIWSAIWPVGEGPILIGRPIANTQLYVLDAQLQPVPFGVAGELYIGGDGLARGYLGRPDLTADRFVPCPWSVVSGQLQRTTDNGQLTTDNRLYRTGDLARCLPNGEIECLGRLDHQVKLRGFRIELGEIEATLTQHEAVQEAVVLAREDVLGEKRLVAYIVSGQEQRTKLVLSEVEGNKEQTSEKEDSQFSILNSQFSGELRAFLKQRLPVYMLPSAFVLLDAMPLTPNGKINVRALPAPTQSQATADASFVAPRTPTEEQLAQIWSGLLGVAAVGVHDNFFELGGHSLLAMQLKTRLQQQFQVELPLRRLFETPTVAALAEHIEAFRETPASTDNAFSPIVPVERQGKLPLSFAQQRLWFLDQLEPDRAIYNIHAAVRFSGPLDLPVLAQSFNELVRRHEILRTNIGAVAGQPFQVIAPSASHRLTVIDLREWPVVERDAEIGRLIAEESRRSFDLAHDALLRTSLIRVGEQEHILLLTMHHIISDGWSLGIFVREATALYSAYSNAPSAPLSALPIQYADYAVWQRERLQGAAFESQVAYWKRQLADLPPPFALPLDRPRRSTRDFHGGQQSLRLPQELSDALRELSHRTEATLFMTLLAAFQVLLCRYSGQEDIIVGAPIAGRTQAEVEGLIGCFLNTLVLRTNLGGNPTFRQLLRRVREVTLGAYEHQELPFEKLVEELQPERDLGRSPLFDILVNLNDTSQLAAELPDLAVNLLPPTEQEAKFALTLYIDDQAEGVSLRLVYQTALFSDERISGILGQLQQLLVQISAAPDAAIRSYSLVTPDARRVLPDPGIVLPAPAYPSVTSLFKLRAEQLPGHPAIRQNQQVWTYSELACRAHELAHDLCGKGIARGDVVAVRGPRSFGLIAGMLAVFLRGSVLLTIDENLPSERQRLILAEAGAKALLDVGAGMAGGEWSIERPAPIILHVNPSTGQIIGSEHAADRATASLPDPAPDDPAYIFFTSGTTGVPKGVLGCHKGLGHFLTWEREAFSVGPQDRCAQLTGLSFDVVLRDIFLPLTSGATLCLPSTLDDLAPDRLLRWLELEQILLLHTTPSLAQTWFAGYAPDITLRDLRWVLFAGEPLVEALVLRLRETFPGLGGIANLYGPTETTLAKCCYIVPVVVRPGIQPVGRPLPETQALVLNDDRRLCGIGEQGQIAIRTPFRSLGYINAPQEQAERFIKNPFQDDQHDLLYYTGDRGRYLPDGTLEILGRLDHQVKIRGVRIEPGEVEAVLARHPAVRACVVVAHEDVPGEKRLVAYVVADQEQRTKNKEQKIETPDSQFSILNSQFSIQELRLYLKTRLPDYMIPADLVLLEALPLTPNGKVDRRALPAPVTDAQPSAAPRTPLEDLLRDCFATVLGRDPATLGVHDNFFASGGHSLLATQLVALLRQRLAIDLPLRTFFEAPTIAALAAVLTTTPLAAAEALLPQPIDRSAPLPLSFAQQRLWFLAQLAPASPAYTIPALLRLRGALDLVALQQSFNALVARHDALRTTFPRLEGRPIQQIAPPFALPLELEELPDVSEAALAARVRQLLAEPFDLATGPLVRVRLLRAEAQTHVLLLLLHHTIADGWSLQVLLQDLAALYSAAVQGAPADLPPLPVQYPEYAMWQRQWMDGALRAAQLEYWRAALAGAPPYLALPTDHPRPALPSYRGARVPIALDAALSVGLRAVGTQYGGTLFMVLLAALDVLLARWSGQADLVVGTAVAGRTRVELERVVGCLMNTLALRVDLGGNPSFGALIGRVRVVALGAYAHQELPFEQLVEDLKPARELSHSPIVQVMFVLQNTPLPSIDVPDLRMEQLDGERLTAKFDLMLELFETPDGLRGSLEYSTDLFERTTIERMVRHLQMLLEQVAGDPERRINDLVLLTTGEQEQLAAWNATARAYPFDQCLHTLIEAQVERTPEAVAVSFEAARLTYRELNQRANQLAHHLIRLGVGPEVPVAVCAERSPELVVALLGVLKAGGAYVPLDPSYPAERLQYMLADAGATVVLTTQEQRTKLVLSEVEGNKEQKIEHDHPQDQARTTERKGVLHTPPPNLEQRAVIALDTDWPTIAQEPATNPDSGVAPENLAYIIYTSGSTGQPKGAMNTHRAICNRLIWMQETYQLTDADRVLQKTPFSFDVSVWEFFWPLLTGARLVLAKPEGHKDSAYLVRLIAEQQITTLHFVPSMLQLFLEEPDLEQCASLRRVICSGEALPFELERRFFYRLRAELHNLYGPTEAAVDVTAWACTPDADVGQIVPIGQPIANIRIHLLDQSLNPVPIGVPGELYIAGVGLARGYLNRPDLTAERFVPSPLSVVSGQLQRTTDPSTSLRASNGQRTTDNRLYRTGDLARYLPTGAIEYLGRIDHQVKIHGFRIELEEIEAALGQHEAVREAVVLAREDRPGDKRLVAYIVPAQEQRTKNTEQRGEEFDSQFSILNSQFFVELQAFLKERLPAYMVPSAFVPLAAMPLTSNGKIDRRALPAPTVHTAPRAAYRAPQSGMERTITSVWQELLGVEKVGIEDNFFDLGGHSLLMIQVAHRLQGILKRDLSVLDLLKYPTVSELARYLGEGQSGAAPQQHDQREQELQAGRDRLKQQRQRRRTIGEGNGRLDGN